MSDSLFHPDDPRLTAYVLGELTDEQRAEVEALLASSPQARRAVDELRDTSAQLFEALQSEPAAALTDEQRASIRATAATAGSPRSAVASTKVRSVRRRTEPPRKPARIAAVLTAVTVCTAIVAAITVPFPANEYGQSIAPTNAVERFDLLAMDSNGDRPSSTEYGFFHRYGTDGSSPAEVSQGNRDALDFDVEPHAVDTSSDAAVKSGAAGNDIVRNPVNAYTSLGLSLKKSEGPPVETAEAPVPAAGGVPSLTATETAPSAGTVVTRGLREHPPTGSPANPPTHLWFPSNNGAARPNSGSQESRFIRVPLVASNETDANTFSWEAGQPAPSSIPARVLGRATPLFAESEAKRQAAPPIEFRSSGQAFELGIPQFQSENVMSNAITPRQEMLYDALRRRELTVRLRDRTLTLSSLGTEQYAPIVENPFVSPTEQPLSTFGLDVDTASYSNVRRFLVDEQRWPPADAVRIEEMVNSFSYADPEPRDEHPLAVTLEAAACPWDRSHRLVRIGVKGREIDRTDRPPTSLVFLIDTSGSMRDDNKLPLVKESLRLLAGEMTENDRIALVTYSTDAGLLLDSTSGEHREAIMTVIDSLQANGSTNGEAGLKLAYEVATRHFIEDGSNRVILCTDGDFNVGESADAPLVRMISEKRDTGIFLSICGFGTGNLKDAKLEQIADHGNGQYHYIDGFKQARKVFLEEISGMLYTIAKDVKLQVEFNPAHVGAYRLLGYENRALAAQDFNNDRIDAGDLGAGHSVTALYEIVPPGGEVAKPATETPGVDPLKYQPSDDPPLAAPLREARPAGDNPQPSRELLTVKLRYKPALPDGSRLNIDAPLNEARLNGDSRLNDEPASDESIKLEFPLVDNADDASPSDDLEWAAAVASFGMILRNSSYRGQSSIEGVLELARGAKGDDPTGARQEFIELVLEARQLHRRETGTPTPKPTQLSSLEAREKASVGGRYRELLDKFDRPADFEIFGDFHDAGHKNASPDGKHPAGYWVYVSPHWYVWKETTAVSEVEPSR